MDMRKYSILFEAYEHYQKTGDRHFDIVPKNSDYFSNVLHAIPYLKRNDYIENVSSNLLVNVTNAFSIIPPESASFDITFEGIHFVESNGKP